MRWSLHSFAFEQRCLLDHLNNIDAFVCLLKLVQLADAAKSLIKCNILVEQFLHYAPSARSHNITVVVNNYILHHRR